MYLKFLSSIAEEPNLRILHCPTNTGGQPWGLSRAERQLGINSTTVCLKQNYLNYPSDWFICGVNDSLILQQLKTWKFVLQSKKQFDVIHYNFGRGFLPWGFSVQPGGVSKIILTLLKPYFLFSRIAERWCTKGSIIAVTFQGDDARQEDFCRKHFSTSIAHYSTRFPIGQDQLNRKKILYFDKISDLIYATNPDLLHILPDRAKYLPYAHVQPKLIEPIYRNPAHEINIIHAPTSRIAKGTEKLLQAVERLKSQGFPCRLTLIEKTSNKQALEIYKKADLVVDQLLAGWYGGFAVEAMALGKPVICYIREHDLKFLPQELRSELPVINSKPEEIYSVLKKWCFDKKSDLIAQGKKSRAFVEKWHNPDQIAQGVIQDYLSVYRSKKLKRKT